MQMEQVEEAKLLRILLTLTLYLHVKYTISLLNHHLYLLNQLHKQGPNVSRLTQVFMALVVARFQYALPALMTCIKFTLYLIKPVDDSLHPILQIQLI